MMTLTASPKTIRTSAPNIVSNRTQPVRTKSPTRPNFWRLLMRALAAPAF